MPARANPPDFPFADVVFKIKEMAQSGCYCYQKFTCAHCGNRLTMEAPNTVYDQGHCDNCGTITDIEKQGCNFLLYAGSMPLGAELRPTDAPLKQVIVVRSK